MTTKFLKPNVKIITLLFAFISPLAVYGQKKDAKDVKDKSAQVKPTGSTNVNLCLLASNGDVKKLEETLKLDRSKINTCTDTDWSPLHIAAFKGHDKVVELLLATSADPDLLDMNYSSPLAVASCYGNLRCAQLLIDADADVNLRDKHGKTALHLAVMFDHTELVKLLLSAGADRTLKDMSTLKSPAEYASLSASKEIQTIFSSKQAKKSS